MTRDAESWEAYWQRRRQVAISRMPPGTVYWAKTLTVADFPARPNVLSENTFRNLRRNGGLMRVGP